MRCGCSGDVDIVIESIQVTCLLVSLILESGDQVAASQITELHKSVLIRSTMPTNSHKVNADELYEAIRNSHGISFEFVSGGVKYRAMLEHKDSRYVKYNIND